jgi:lysylphosphatidylglycerol synthetase-like protein (DUF2156 family)
MSHCLYISIHGPKSHVIECAIKVIVGIAGVVSSILKVLTWEQLVLLLVFKQLTIAA